MKRHESAPEPEILKRVTVRLPIEPERARFDALLEQKQKDMIRRWVEQHPFSARQILRRLREQGYVGGYTMLKEYLHLVRPVRPRAYLTLHYAPGE